MTALLPVAGWLGLIWRYAVDSRAANSTDSSPSNTSRCSMPLISITKHVEALRGA